ncbi:MAG TPA: CPBP family intramembrane glutamic endopeptidase [Saprospiraceae bacterium]|nr:CPBP family intramembrane glutamic endopeptidase [Saprospiraceae bacterium]
MSFILEANNTKYKRWGWYVLCILCLIIAFMIGQSPLTAVVRKSLDKGLITQTEAVEIQQTANFEVLGLSSALGLLLILGSFVVAFAMLYLFVITVHGRKFKSLITTGNIRWERIGFAFIVWFVLAALTECILYFRDPDVYHVAIDWSTWLPLMLVVLFVLPLQTSFEELFIRGYLLQGIGLAANRPWIAVVTTALIFGLMHLGNPEIKQFGHGIMMFYYISVGVFLATLTILDDGLELALGIHAATNIYGAGFVTFTGSAIQTDALIKVELINPVWLVALSYLSMIGFIFLVLSRYHLQNWKVLFAPVRPIPLPISENSMNIES